MLKNLIFLLILSSVVCPVQAQSDAIDSLIELERWQDLTSLSAKADAAYDWVRDHIRYRKTSYIRTQEVEPQVDIAIRTLKNKSGVCIGYASLTSSLFTRLGIQAFVIEGYSRTRSSIEAHAWMIFKIDSIWRLADPTWDAGYFVNNRYQKRISRKYYQMPADQFINDHYPLDPAFQLLSTPIHFEEFRNRTNVETEIIDFEEILKNYEFSPKEDQLRRSISFKPNDLYLKHSLGVVLMDQSKEAIDPCLQTFNKNFTLDDICMKLIAEVRKDLQEAQSLFTQILAEANPFYQMAEINLLVVNRNLGNLDALEKQFK